MNRFHAAVFAVILTISSVAAAGERIHPPLEGPPEQGMDDMTGPVSRLSAEQREEIRKKIEAVRVWRMTEALKLDEKTAAKFIPVISSIEHRRAELMREQMDAMRDLRQGVASQRPDEKRLKAVIDKIELNHREMMKLREKEMEAAKDYLTIEQQARFLVFLHEFQRDMRRMINRAQGGRGMEGRRGSGMGMMNGGRRGVD